jgi:hypothetical protein
MDAEKLKKHAELLERAIQANAGKSKDVDWLAQYPYLVQAIADAKAYRITEPSDLGLSRWIFESNIQKFDEITERLCQFEILLKGWPLPSDQIKEDKKDGN